MNRTALRRVAAPGIAALALGLAVSACGASNENGGGSSSDSKLSGTLKGAGSSAQEAAMDAWRAGFQTDNSKVTVNYDPAGSGAGVEQFNAGAIDFAGSDSALDAEKGEVDAAKQRCGGVNALEVPNYVSPIAVVYNLQGVDKLQLSPATLGKIFSGEIKKWNDPAIAAENDGVTLPGDAIAPVHRSDESGTTKNFTDYLEKASGGSWKFPADKVWPIKSGEAAAQTSGMVAAVKAGKGSIGYADESQATDLQQASIKVGDAYVAPSAEGAAKALEASPVDDSRTEGDLAVKVDRTTTEPGAYPLMLTSYVIACPTYDAAKADLVKGFLSYVVSTDGQSKAADNAGSAPLPSSLQQKAAEIIDGIKAK
ncbi:MAG: phosphate ABC transporter substrate-binding protein PstS [Nocardioidaceae bacterium]|nr:phosphate ABC transporter substrate-binding protein PstS [Nocardioidaceae bacterium]